MGRGISNGCQTCRAMIWWGLLTVWIGYVIVSHLFASHSSHRRLSMLSIPPVSPSGSVCASSDIYAAIGWYCQHHIHPRLNLWMSITILQPRGIPLMCTKGPSTVQKFASNVPMAGWNQTECVALSFPQPTMNDGSHRPSTKRL